MALTTEKQNTQKHKPSADTTCFLGLTVVQASVRKPTVVWATGLVRAGFQPRGKLGVEKPPLWGWPLVAALVTCPPMAWHAWYLLLV